MDIADSSTLKLSMGDRGHGGAFSFLGKVMASIVLETEPPKPVKVTETEVEVPQLSSGSLLPEAMGKDACPWLDDYVTFSRKWSPRSFDGFHEATGLWLLSTIAARRVCVHFGKPRFTNLYLLLCGRTTIHAKSSATEVGRQLLQDAGLAFLLAPDESTPQAFVKSMSDSNVPSNYGSVPSTQARYMENRLAFIASRGWYHEEFGSGLEAMLRPNGAMADYRGLLRVLDDCPKTYSRETISRGIDSIDRPYLSLVGNVTPSDLRPLAKKGSMLWGDGFLARFAPVVPPTDEVLSGRFPVGERIIPNELRDPLCKWHERLGIPRVFIDDETGSDGKSNGKQIARIDPVHITILSFDGEVREAWYAYDDGIRSLLTENKQEDLDGNYGRFGEKCLRVATLFASLQGCDAVELRHLAKAQRIVERWRVYTHRLHEQVTLNDESDEKQLEDKTLAVFRRHQGKEKYKKGMTASEVARFLRGLSTPETKALLDSLHSASVLTKSNAGRACRYHIPGLKGLK